MTKYFAAVAAVDHTYYSYHRELRLPILRRQHDIIHMHGYGAEVGVTSDFYLILPSPRLLPSQMLRARGQLDFGRNFVHNTYFRVDSSKVLRGLFYFKRCVPGKADFFHSSASLGEGRLFHTPALRSRGKPTFPPPQRFALRGGQLFVLPSTIRARGLPISLPSPAPLQLGAESTVRVDTRREKPNETGQGEVQYRQQLSIQLRSRLLITNSFACEC